MLTPARRTCLVLTLAALGVGGLACATRGGSPSAEPRLAAFRQELPAGELMAQDRQLPERGRRAAEEHARPTRRAGTQGRPALAEVAPRPDGSGYSHAGLGFEALRTGELDGRILHGGRPLYNDTDHDAYLAAFPDTPSVLLGGGLNLGDIRRTPEERVRLLEGRLQRHPGEIPFVSIWYTRLAEGSKTEGDGLDEAVLAGQFDANLVLVAEMLKRFGVPVFVRIAPEFNTARNGYRLMTFAPSYRHIVDLFRRQGVDNAIYVWNYMPLNGPFPYMDWYPGDDVVDWWSVDVFDSAFERAGVRDEILRYLGDAEARGKPVVIAECAPAMQDVDDPRTWERWFEPFFRLVNEHGQIKAFLYSNVDFRVSTRLPGWNDVRLPGSAMAERFAAELRKPQYLHRP